MFEKVCCFCGQRYPFRNEFCTDDGTPLAVVLLQSLAGVTLGGRYELIEEIGKGELGVVYKARHLKMDNVVAVKLLMSDPHHDEENLQRFRLEARAASQLSHPGIVRIYDFDFMPDGVPYLVMEYLEGSTMQQILDSEGKLPAPRVLSLGIQISSALIHAHRRGVVHRDVKPTNIMFRSHDVDEEERAVVLDFGIAKVFTYAGKTLQRLTKSGQIFTSPLYMSPEQCMGQFSEARSDIYSLGCFLYHALCGSPPFVGRNYLQTVFMHVNETPDPIAARLPEGACPPELNAVLMKALSKSPDQRQQTMLDFKRDLEKVLEGMLEPTRRRGEAGPPQASADSNDAGKEQGLSQRTTADAGDDAQAEEEYEEGEEHKHSSKRPSGQTDDDEDDAEREDYDAEIRDDEPGLIDDEYDQHLHKTIRDYLKRAKRGRASDMYDLAWHYRTGELVKKDQRKAFYWFLKAAEGGDDDAMVTTGDNYLYGRGVRKNGEEAFRWWMRAADKGNRWGLKGVGDAYMFGWGVRRNVKMGAVWYEKAAEKGMVSAQKELAKCCEHGWGVEVDRQRAADWWFRAAQKGDKHAQYRIGVCLTEGIGLPVDIPEAIGWLECSAGQGYCLGRIQLALCYEKGLGVEKNPDEALTLITQAAEDGCSDAQEILKHGFDAWKRMRFRRQKSSTRDAEKGSTGISSAGTATHADVVRGPEMWGDTRHARYFYLQDDGTAIYKIRSGETLEMIAKDILRSICPQSESAALPYEEQRELIDAIKRANQNLPDFNYLPSEHDLVIPLPYVVRVKAARNEKLLIKANGKHAEIYFPDGTHRKIFRSGDGAAQHVEDCDKQGLMTIYRREGKRWLVMQPGQTGFTPYKGQLLTD